MGSPGPSTREQIRARHGAACWLCNGKLSFASNANDKRKPTIEHLQPQSLGGGNELDNLRLCHLGCNQQLANRPRVEKEQIREKRERARARNAAKLAQAGSPAAQPATAGKGKAATSKATPLPPQPGIPSPRVAAGATIGRTAASIAMPQGHASVILWQRTALGAIGSTLFLGGLVLGMFLG